MRTVPVDRDQTARRVPVLSLPFRRIVTVSCVETSASIEGTAGGEERTSSGIHARVRPSLRRIKTSPVDSACLTSPSHHPQLPPEQPLLTIVQQPFGRSTKSEAKANRARRPCGARRSRAGIPLQPEKRRERLLRLEIPWLQDSFRVSAPSTVSRYASGPKTLPLRLSLKVFVASRRRPRVFRVQRTGRVQHAAHLPKQMLRGERLPEEERPFPLHPLPEDLPVSASGPEGHLPLRMQRVRSRKPVDGVSFRQELPETRTAGTRPGQEDRGPRLDGIVGSRATRVR